MTDRPTDLCYGHLGEAQYDRRSQTWRFQRNPDVGPRLMVVGSCANILPASKQHMAHEHTVQERKTQINKIANIYPDLVPAVDELLQCSKETSATVDPHVTYLGSAQDLIAFGEVVDQQDPTKQILVTATAEGENGHSVRLLRYERDGHNIRRGVDAPCRPWISDSMKTSSWVSSCNTVEQLYFSSPCCHETSILIVLTHADVTILRPYVAHRLGNEYLRFEWLGRLSFDERDHVRPISATFDPEDHLQLFLLEKDARWSIWEMTPSKPSSSPWRFKRRLHGSLIKDADFLYGQKQQVDPSWGSCVWTKHPEVIVVTLRRSCYLIWITLEMQVLELSETILDNGKDMAVDLKAAPGHMGHFMIATISRILLVQINADATSPTHILISWRHFRDVEDLTLRLDLFLMPSAFKSENRAENDDSEWDQTLTAVLYSRLTGVINVYNFVRDGAVSSTFVTSAQDPYCLVLETDSFPLESSDNRVARDNRHLERGILSLTLGPKKPLKLMNLVRSGRYLVFPLTVLFDDLSVSMFPCTISNYEGDRVTWARLSDSSSETAATTGEDNFDEFIVADESDGVLEAPASADSIPVDAAVKEDGNAGEENPWTLNYTWLVQAIESHARLRNAEGSRSPLEILVKLLYSSQQDMNYYVARGSPCFRSLLELTGSNIAVEDVDLFSERLDMLLRSPQMHQLGLISLDQRLSQDWSSSLSSTYEQVLEYWIKSLPDDISSVARVDMAKKVRHVSAEIFLSGFGINSAQAQSAILSFKATPSSQSKPSFELPIHSKPLQNRSEDRLHHDDVGQGEALDAIPQVARSKQRSALEKSQKQHENVAIMRLRDFVQFKSSLIVTKSSLLSKWKVGKDSDDYPWTEPQAAWSSDEESEGNVSLPQRNKLDHGLSGRREKTMKTSSQPAPRRSPQFHSQATLPSNQTAETALTTTQPEASPHGNQRPVKKQMKKPRKPGFK